MQVILVDDNESHLTSLKDAVRTLGHECTAFSDPKKVVEQCSKEHPPLVITDIRMPDLSGLDLLDAIKSNTETRTIDVILVTGQGDEATAIAALRKGAYDYLRKPLNLNELEIALDKVAEHQSLLHANRELLERFDTRLSRSTESLMTKLKETKKIVWKNTGHDGLITRSHEMEQLVQRAKMYHNNPEVPVIIEGETGTGKEVFAKVVHFGDDKVDTPFVAINCSTLTGQLVESELFGYAKGAFTGSNPEGQPGKLELAGDGSLFLDEIGDLPVEFQPKLLRVLEDRTYYRVGGLKKKKFNARVICASNRNLEIMIQEGEFRLDLFHRLNLGYIRIPPLRKRREDIPVLAEYFLKRAVERRRTPARAFGAGVEEKLMTYDWPGNVRELENTVERAVLNTTAEKIPVESVVFVSGIAPNPNTPIGVPAGNGVITLPPDGLNLDQHINNLVQEVLDKFDGNKSKAAEYLGMSWAALNRRLKKASK